jgi:hypothetical protein
MGIAFGDAITGSFSITPRMLEVQIRNKSKDGIVIKGFWNKIAGGTLEIDKSGKIGSTVGSFIKPDYFNGNRIWIHLQPHDPKYQNAGSSAILRRPMEDGEKTKELLAAPKGSLIRFQCEIWTIMDGVMKLGRTQEVILVKD